MQTQNSEESVQAEWYALYTRNQHEKNVAQILSSRGFEVFLPLYHTVHRWKDRNKELWLPLFPCYVFLKGGLERRSDIVTTPGMYAFVGAGGRAEAVPGAEIGAIRRAAEGSVRAEPHPLLTCGDRVRVKSGALEGVEGVLVRKKDVYRLVVCVELLGRAVALDVDAYLVERVGFFKPPAASSAPPAWH